MEKQSAPLTLYKALFEVQKQIPALARDGDNPYHKSKYITLDSLWSQIKPIMHEHGLLLMQLPEMHENTVTVRTRIIHAESGEMVENELSMPLPVTTTTDPQTGLITTESPRSQDVGSAITYGKRYSMAAMLGIVADPDDDGNAASGRRMNGKAASGHAGQRSDTKLISEPVGAQGRFIGVIQKLESEKVKSRKEANTYYTKYVLRTKGGDFETFDQKLADKARLFAVSGEDVAIDWEQTQYGKKAKAIEQVAETTVAKEPELPLAELSHEKQVLDNEDYTAMSQALVDMNTDPTKCMNFVRTKFGIHKMRDVTYEACEALLTEAETGRLA